jgi:hypothetical protein
MGAIGSRKFDGTRSINAIAASTIRHFQCQKTQKSDEEYDGHDRGVRLVMRFYQELPVTR